MPPFARPSVSSFVFLFMTLALGACGDDDASAPTDAAAPVDLATIDANFVA